MKSLLILVTIVFFAFLSVSTLAQIDLGKKKAKVEGKIKEKKKKAEEKIDEKIDNAIDKFFEDTEETINSTIDENMQNSEQESPADSNAGLYEEPRDNEFNAELNVWSKYDFVSGEKIIFTDNLENEKHGEFPSKWNLVSGNAENAKFGDENVIAFMKNKTEISPLNKQKEYLPEVFTIEFDIYFNKKVNEAYFLNLKNLTQLEIRTNKVSLRNYEGVPDKTSSEAGWHHIALSFNKRALKVYFDQTRVLNIPDTEKKPTAFSISALSHGAAKGIPSMIKNIRVAEGGVELYDRLINDGRIVTTGIYFDTGKASIKPESMGIINEIARLMNDHPEINFSIEGHTDSDGESLFNQTLSENRAKAVKDLLVGTGIDASRLNTKGFGESKPVKSNLIPEEKANNRRVEFVKI